MTIIDKIKMSVEGATGLPYYYDTPQTLGVRLDSAKFPCAMMHVAESGAVTDDNGIVRERLTVELLVADLSRLDFDGIEAERQIDPLKHHALRWLASMRRNHDLQLVAVNGTQRYYATEDAIVVAYGVNVTLQEREGVSACEV